MANQQAYGLGQNFQEPTLPLAVLHQKARERLAALEAELQQLDGKRQELVRLRNWVAWLEQAPGDTR